MRLFDEESLCDACFARLADRKITYTIRPSEDLCARCLAKYMRWREEFLAAWRGFEWETFE